MKCKFCGAEVELGKICEYCGSRAEKEYYHTQEVQKRKQERQPRPHPRPEPKGQHGDNSAGSSGVVLL